VKEEIQMLDRLKIYQDIKEYVDWLQEQNFKENLNLTNEEILIIAGQMDRDRDELITLLGCKYSRRPISNNNTFCKVRRYNNINVLHM
jgi:hypothetical protein